MVICIAGQNDIAVNVLQYILKIKNRDDENMSKERHVQGNIKI